MPKDGGDAERQARLLLLTSLLSLLRILVLRKNKGRAFVCLIRMCLVVASSMIGRVQGRQGRLVCYAGHACTHVQGLYVWMRTHVGASAQLLLGFA